MQEQANVGPASHDTGVSWLSAPEARAEWCAIRLGHFMLSFEWSSLPAASNLALMHEAFGVEAVHWLSALLALVIVASVLEGLVLQKCWHQSYDWRAFAASFADLVGRRLIDALGFSVAAPLLHWCVVHRLSDWALTTPLQWLLLFMAHELAYYAYHRCAHRVHWFWATHAVHHSPNQLTLAAAFRLGWTGKLSGHTLFFAPLLWLGASSQAVFGLLALNLLYQFWLHAPWMPRLGPLEWVLNTPSHHRIHHASNPEYLDCNYGGVLIVYDRLFGSLVTERADVVPRYGLSTPIHSHNPLRIAAVGWLGLWNALTSARGLRAWLVVIFGPPRRAGRCDAVGVDRAE